MIQPSMQHNYTMNLQSKKHIHPFPTFLGNLCKARPYSKLSQLKHGIVGQGENLWDLSHVIDNFILESFDVKVLEN
jgi:hypothetical protein